MGALALPSSASTLSTSGLVSGRLTALSSTQTPSNAHSSPLPGFYFYSLTSLGPNLSSSVHDNCQRMFRQSQQVSRVCQSIPLSPPLATTPQVASHLSLTAAPSRRAESLESDFRFYPTAVFRALC